MNQFKTFAFMSLVVGLLCACSSGGGGSSAGVTAAAAPTGNQGPIVTVAELSGNWQSLCGVSYVGQAASEQYVLSFNAALEASVTVNAYSSSDCSGLPQLSTVVNGSFAISGLDAVVNGASDLNYAPVSASMTPASASEAAALNAESFCGMTNWQAGVPQTIGLANSCLTVPMANNQIIQISGSELYFGNTDDTEINTFAGYSKM